MIILGISGFEDIRRTAIGIKAKYSDESKNELFLFSADQIPLQYFPLHLIGHDCSVAILIDGELIAFAAEERFSRIKHGLNLAGRTVLPRSAIEYCLQEAGITWKDVDYIAHFCDFNPISIDNRIKMLSGRLNASQQEILMHQYYDIYDYSMKLEILSKQLTKIAGTDIDGKNIIPIHHHLAHAAGAYYSSGYSDALIMSIDGYGEEESSIIACGTDENIQIIDQIKLPTSLGLLYQVITTYLGFRFYGDEYKVMGLSSYGNSKRYSGVFKELIQLEDDGKYCITEITSPCLMQILQDYFGRIGWINDFSQKAADIAAALQDALEKTILHSLDHYQCKTQLKRLCLSGGVALNATANGIIKRSGLFKDVFIQPAAADDGTSLGAAFCVNSLFSKESRNKPVVHTYWGPSYNADQIKQILQTRHDIQWQKEEDIVRTTAELLSKGKLVGWFQGRMEMGPRALGARSILSDPRKMAYRNRLNSKIKNREMFRPFSPSVLEEEAENYFVLDQSGSDPYMITTVPVRTEKRSLIPAVVHINDTSRLQTVSEKTNPVYYRLIREFYFLTGIPMVLNTSFNQAGEPIVCSPEDALNCFTRCGLDVLVMEDYLICPVKTVVEKNETEKIHIA